MKQLSFEQIITQLDKFSWREWVFTKSPEEIDTHSVCIVLDPDDTEYGADGDTPLEVERNSMQEFLSINDLRSIRGNLFSQKPEAGVLDIAAAARHYFENDAFVVLLS